MHIYAYTYMYVSVCIYIYIYTHTHLAGSFWEMLKLCGSGMRVSLED